MFGGSTVDRLFVWEANMKFKLENILICIINLHLPWLKKNFKMYSFYILKALSRWLIFEILNAKNAFIIMIWF